MRALIQRVLHAKVDIDSTTISQIGKGLLVFVGIEDKDGLEDISWLGNKLVNLRIFDDGNKIPNLSVKEIEGDILLVSQFTLHAATKKGNRPGYSRASKPSVALPVYQSLISFLEKDLGKKIFTGEFGADMKVHILNDGPVTIWIDTKMRE
ncbi:MAG: D-aminoacyl-tRNA deacylase [Ferruginibacter sp.]